MRELESFVLTGNYATPKKLASCADIENSGGIRGIVQLQVLKAIERVLGPKLPIQNFFDLMVGTGYVCHNPLSFKIFGELICV